MPTLIIDVTPSEAAEIATLQVDNLPLIGNRVELERPRRIHVAVTAMGFTRYSQDVEVERDMVLRVELAKRPHKRSRALAVSLGMGAVAVLAWLVRRR